MDKPTDSIQPPLHIDAQRGNDTNSGKDWGNALQTLAEGLKRVKRGGVINLYGKFLENGLVTPHGVTDVTVKGAGTRPREGNVGRSAGPKNGACDWRWKDDATTKPLLHVTQQGWKFENLMLRGSPEGGTILLTRTLLAETSDLGMAGDHATFQDCVFQGQSPYGICQEGGVANIQVKNCMFRIFSKPGQWAILGKTGEGVGYPIVWDISNNMFVANYGDINCGVTDSVVRGNIFQRQSVLATGIPADAVSFDLPSGRGNVVIGNCFDKGIVRQGSYDRWYDNHFYGDGK